MHSPHGATRPTLSGGAASAAAALLFASGLLTFAVGVSAVAAIDLEVSGRGFEYTFHVTSWGWVNIVAGIVLALAAVGLFSTTAWARPVAVRSYARGHHIHVPVDAVLPRVVGGAGYRGRRDMHGVRHDTRRPERRLLAPAALREHLALRGLALPFVSQIQPTGSIARWAVRAAWLAASCSGDGPSVVGAGFAEDVVNVQLVTADQPDPRTRLFRFTRMTSKAPTKRRFFVRAPDGNVVNIVYHRDGDCAVPLMGRSMSVAVRLQSPSLANRHVDHTHFLPVRGNQAVQRRGPAPEGTKSPAPLGSTTFAGSSNFRRRSTPAKWWRRRFAEFSARVPSFGV